MAGRIIAITGAFGGLGPTVAHAAAAQGARLALIGRGQAPSSGLPAGEDVLILEGIALPDQRQTAIAFTAIEARFAGLNALLNIAGGFASHTLEGGSVDDWAAMHRINLVTAVSACAAALPLLRKSPAGRIVNVGSYSALKAGAGMGPYAAAKCGVHALTQALAAELKAAGVGVNAVLPSTIDTPANRASMPGADFSSWVPPGDLARLMLDLASEASAETGALLPVTGPA